MLITEVTATMLPLYVIEILPVKKPAQVLTDELFYPEEPNEPEWYVFTEEPFDNKEHAEIHRLLILKEYPSTKPENVRVGLYTQERWRDDLVRAMLKDEDALRRALSLLRPETLVDLLRPDGEPNLVRKEVPTPHVVVWNLRVIDSPRLIEKVYGTFDSVNQAYQWAKNHHEDVEVDAGYYIRPLLPPEEQ